MDSLISQALDKTNKGIIIVNKDLKIVLWNQWLERFTDKERGEVLGRDLTEVCPRFKTYTYLEILQNALYHGQNRFCSSTLHQAFILPGNNQDYQSIKQNMQVEPLYDGDYSYALIQIDDVTNIYSRVHRLKNLLREMEEEFNEIKTSEKISRHLSMHDSLTDLPNRLYFNDRLAWALSYAKRNREKAAVMFMDLDGFKAVNDTYGHEAGDKILVETAKRFRGCIRSTDTIARLGGDEFSVVLSQLKNESDAEIIARKFIRMIEAPFMVDDNPIALSISIGISLFPRDGEEPAVLLNKADKAMYKVKAKGKNGFAYIDEDMMNYRGATI